MKIELTKEELEWICDGLGCRQSEWDDVPEEILKKFRNLLDEWKDESVTRQAIDIKQQVRRCDHCGTYDELDTCL